MDSKVLHEYLKLFQFIFEPKGCQENYIISFNIPKIVHMLETLSTIDEM